MLGLLSDVGTGTARVTEIQRFLSFHHKTLQEFSASKHVVKTLDECSDKKVCNLGAPIYCFASFLPKTD